jgi:hypothetical protein
MKPHGAVSIDPPELESAGRRDAIEIFIPYTEWALGVATMEGAAALASKLQPIVRLIAVHTVPYPVQFGCLAAIHGHLVEQLVDLASRSPLTVHPQVVLARSRREGFRSALPAESTVLIGARRRFWRTPEDRLAAMLAGDGHKVALIHVE